MKKIITFTTDFGLSDFYVAAMKGTVLSLAPDACLIDVTHDIPCFDIFQAHLVLKQCYKNFPQGTIHVAIVDPGVGSERLPLIVQTKNYFFVGPDNGLFSFLAQDDIEQIYTINKDAVNHGLVSPTFHGRDIFAPTAALLAQNIPPQKIAQVVSSLKTLTYPQPQFHQGFIEGQVIAFDHFGNAITNIIFDDFINILQNRLFELHIKSQRIHTLSRTYSDVALGQPLLLKGSHGFLEIAGHCFSIKKEWLLEKNDFFRIEVTKP